MLRLCLCVALLAFASKTRGDELELHFAADGETDISFGGQDFGDALMKTGDLGGVLKSAEIHASAEAAASASYKAVGEGYSLGIDAHLNASGYVQTEPNRFDGSSSSIDVRTSYRDAYTLVGEASIPFDSTNLNLRLEGSFSNTVNDPDEFWGVSAEVRLEDRETHEDYVIAEYSRAWNGNHVGTTQASGLFTISKPLGADARTSVHAGLRILGHAGDASLSINLGDTLRLESITFPDGSTPEEHGFAIVFDSGLVSPNLGLTLAAADFGLDGIVEGKDFLRWQRGAGISEDALTIHGDADGDNDVDGADLLLWQASYGDSAFTWATSVAVPEPTSFSLLGFVAATCVFAAARRRLRTPCKEAL